MPRAFTLVEIIIVLVILAALAGMVVPLLGEIKISTPTGEKSEEEVVTEATMNSIRDVMMGTAARQGVWADVGQRPEYFPQRIAGLLAEGPPVPVGAFDPVTKIGWRGPYFARATGRFDLTSLDGTFSDARYGAQNDLALVDAWGNPIVIQVNFDGGEVTAAEAQYARLVSAGANEVLDTPYDTNNMQPEALTKDEYADDLVLFLRTADTRP